MLGAFLLLSTIAAPLASDSQSIALHKTILLCIYSSLFPQTLALLRISQSLLEIAAL
jgi:hypothetical protein